MTRQARDRQPCPTRVAFKKPPGPKARKASEASFVRSEDKSPMALAKEIASSAKQTASLANNDTCEGDSASCKADSVSDVFPAKLIVVRTKQMLLPAKQLKFRKADIVSFGADTAPAKQITLPGYQIGARVEL